MKVAALFVQKRGVYFGIPDVETWDEPEDPTQPLGKAAASRTPLPFRDALLAIARSVRQPPSGAHAPSRDGVRSQ